MVIVKMPERLKPRFSLSIGIDTLPLVESVYAGKPAFPLKFSNAF